MVKDIKNINLEESKSLNEGLESLMINSVNSEAFIDPNGKIGRRGILTYIEPNDLSIKHVWAVMNSKVFVLYESKNFLTIVKLFRNSAFELKDSGSSPCFVIYSNIEKQSHLLCSTSTIEKEVWIDIIRTNLNIE